MAKDEIIRSTTARSDATVSVSGESKTLPPIEEGKPIDEQMSIYSCDSIVDLVPTRKEVLWRKYRNVENLWERLQSEAENGQNTMVFEHTNAGVIKELEELLTDYMGYQCIIDNTGKTKLTITWKHKLDEVHLPKSAKETTRRSGRPQPARR